MRRLVATTRGRLTLVASGILLVALVLSDVVLALGFAFSQSASTDAQLR